MIFTRDKEKKITRIKFWKLDLTYSEQEKVYMGNWKWGNGERLVGSFLLVKKKK
jgi:hypothetical protein